MSVDKDTARIKISGCHGNTQLLSWTYSNIKSSHSIGIPSNHSIIEYDYGWYKGEIDDKINCPRLIVKPRTVIRHGRWMRRIYVCIF